MDRALQRCQWRSVSTPVGRRMVATLSGMTSFARPIDGAWRGKDAPTAWRVNRAMDWMPMPATTYLDEALCNKIRQKLMFNPRDTATKLT
jgi:hypothetical protein